jgi:hypothetical protein
MSNESNYPGAERALTRQAIVELTEANLSTASHEEEWDQEVEFLRESDGDRRGAMRQAEVDAVIDLSTLMA